MEYNHTVISAPQSSTAAVAAEKGKGVLTTSEMYISTSPPFSATVSTCSFASARKSLCADPNQLFDTRRCNTSPEQESVKFQKILRQICSDDGDDGENAYSYDLRVATFALVKYSQVISVCVAIPANLFWINNW